MDNNGWNFSHIEKMIRRTVRNSLDLNKHEMKKLKKELKKEFKKVGEDLSNAGEDVLKSFKNIGMDFSGKNVSEKSSGEKFSSDYQNGPSWQESSKENQNTDGDASHNRHTRHRHNRGAPNFGTPYPPTNYPPNEKETALAVKAPISVAGVLMLVFGGLGLGLSVLITIAVITMSLVSGYGASMLGGITAVLACLYALNGGLIWRGARRCSFNKRFGKYLKEIRGSDFCPIAMLASATGQTEDFVVKDLRKMIRRGMFPNGHLDKRKTCLILNYETYQQYLRAEEEMKRRQQQAEEEKRLKEREQKVYPEQQKQQAQQNTEMTDLQRAINEGYQYIQEIRKANDCIPGEEISKKISHLETVTTKIFEYVEQHPEKLPEIRKFMSYYLPTTLKLLKAYEDFDYQPVQGENIRTAKLEIQSTLDTINIAFENLLDNLFGDMALDISTDISVLESMLAQEGLTPSEFANKTTKPSQTPPRQL